MSGQMREEGEVLQSDAEKGKPATLERHASNGTGQPQNARSDASRGTKRSLEVKPAGADSQAKGGRGQTSQGVASKQRGKDTAADKPQSGFGMSPDACMQPSAAVNAQHAPEDVSGVDAKQEEGDAEEFIARGVVRRSVEEMAECLACDLCRSILRDPITAPECMHSFCRECVEAELVGSLGGNICPACAQEGERTLLGANPFAHHRLQPDFVLEALVRKIFPRHILEDYEKRRPKYVAQRIGQLSTEAGARPSRARGQQMPPADVVPLFLHQKGKGEGNGDGKQLDMPYLRVPKALPVAILAKYVAQRVSEPAGARIQLFYKDTELSEAQTIHEAAEMCMPPGSSGSALLELCYLVVQIAERQSSETENDIDSV